MGMWGWGGGSCYRHVLLVGLWAGEEAISGCMGLGRRKLLIGMWGWGGGY